MSVQIAGYPLPQRPELALEAELARLRKRAMRLCSSAHGGPALVTDKDLLQVLHRLIELEARAAEQAAEVEWQRADSTGEAASAIRIPAGRDDESREARELAASQARRQIRRLKQQSNLHIVSAQAWELRSEQLRNAGGKLAAEPAPVSAPVVEVPRGPMAAALDSINREMVGGEQR
jgi:hypothetical protein